MTRALPSWLSLDGRVALVTGAGSPTGIGFAAARALGELGATVWITATTDRVHERVSALRTRSIDAHGVVIDLRDESAVSAMVEDILRTSRAIDVLVNNAGMVSVGAAGEQGSVVDTSTSTWRHGLARNLDTAFFVSRSVLPGMTARGWGRIVNVASVTGPQMAMRNEAVYATAKAGMVGLTRSMAVDVADRGVTVNAVAPGWIATASQTEDEARQAASTPIGRSGTADEVASAIASLCTPGASYVTGQCLVIDGGNAIAEERA